MFSLLNKHPLFGFYYVMSVMVMACFSDMAMADEDHRVLAWNTDIIVYAEQLEKRHINLFHNQSAQAFNRQVDKLKHAVPSLTDNQILVKLMALTSSIGDGHTSFPLWGAANDKFPIRLNVAEGKYFVEQTTQAHQHLLGSELVAINQQPINGLVASMTHLVPFAENAYSTAVRTAQYLTIAQVLNGLGVIEANYVADFTFLQNGQTVTQRLYAEPNPQFADKLVLEHPALSSKQQHIDKGLWFTASPDKQSVYIKFTRYVDFDAMMAFASNVLSFINQYQSRHLIIDLRDNYGGDFFIGLVLAQQLVLADSLDWQNSIYVLINNHTFSAAMSNAAQYKRLLNATLVGEPTGARPAGYQDMGQFTLPNSQRVVTYSKRIYDFLGSDANAVYPDIPISLTLDDYNNNQDRQLQLVLDAVNWK